MRDKCETQCVLVCEREYRQSEITQTHTHTHIHIHIYIHTQHTHLLLQGDHEKGSAVQETGPSAPSEEEQERRTGAAAKQRASWRRCPRTPRGATRSTGRWRVEDARGKPVHSKCEWEALQGARHDVYMCATAGPRSRTAQSS